MLAPYDPSFQNPAPALSLHPPDAAHLLGTTQSGQDVLSQLLVGIRLTLELALSVGVIATALSSSSAWRRPSSAVCGTRCCPLATNVFLVIPALPLLIILLGYLPQKGQLATIVVLSGLGWPWGARLIRAQTLAIRNRDFVAASRETGEPTWRILAVEIVPNEVSLIAASFVNTVLYAIGASVALAFIGLADLTSWSLGTMLYWAQSQQALQLGAWWWFVPPGLAVALIGTALVLLNSGHRRARQPAAARRRQRQRGRLAQAAAHRPDPGAAGAPAAPRRSPASSTRSPAARSSTKTASEVSCRDRASARDRGFLRRLPDPRPATCGRSRQVNLELYASEVVGLVGESGSGKSTLAYGACRLLRAPALITGGSVRYQGRRAADADGHAAARPRRAAAAALAGDRHRVPERDERAEPGAQRPRPAARRHPRPPADLPRRGARDKAASLLDLVGIPRSRLRSYPHELSGGMRQRVMIAMALATDPEIVIMDEPTTALDVVVQRDILAQIVELKERLGFSILFITHDLSLLLELADRIAVMYAGQLLEIGTAAADRSASPAHPYTRGLLNSFPSLRGARRELAGIPGSPPDLHDPPPGCPFLPRCGYGTEAAPAST